MWVAYLSACFLIYISIIKLFSYLIKKTSFWWALSVSSIIQKNSNKGMFLVCIGVLLLLPLISQETLFFYKMRFYTQFSGSILVFLFFILPLSSGGYLIELKQNGQYDLWMTTEKGYFKHLMMHVLGFSFAPFLILTFCFFVFYQGQTKLFNEAQYVDQYDKERTKSVYDRPFFKKPYIFPVDQQEASFLRVIHSDPKQYVFDQVPPTPYPLQLSIKPFEFQKWSRQTQIIKIETDSKVIHSTINTQDSVNIEIDQNLINKQGEFAFKLSKTEPNLEDIQLSSFSPLSLNIRKGTNLINTIWSFLMFYSHYLVVLSIGVYIALRSTKKAIFTLILIGGLMIYFWAKNFINITSFTSETPIYKAYFLNWFDNSFENKLFNNKYNSPGQIALDLCGNGLLMLCILWVTTKLMTSKK